MEVRCKLCGHLHGAISLRDHCDYCKGPVCHGCYTSHVDPIPAERPNWDRIGTITRVNETIKEIVAPVGSVLPRQVRFRSVTYNEVRDQTCSCYGEVNSTKKVERSHCYMCDFKLLCDTCFETHKRNLTAYQKGLANTIAETEQWLNDKGYHKDQRHSLDWTEDWSASSLQSTDTV